MSVMAADIFIGGSIVTGPPRSGSRAWILTGLSAVLPPGLGGTIAASSSLAVSSALAHRLQRNGLLCATELHVSAYIQEYTPSIALSGGAAAAACEAADEREALLSKSLSAR